MGKSILVSVLLLILASCHQQETDHFSTPFKSYFTLKLKSADSSIVLKSFEYLKTDTVNEKWALNRQRYPFLNSLEAINEKLNNLLVSRPPTAEAKENTAKQMEQLQNEKNMLSKSLDSINLKILSADSILPVGYIARFQYTVIMKNGNVRTDTIGYSLDKNMKMIDWDDNNEKSIDSIVNGNRPVLR